MNIFIIRPAVKSFHTKTYFFIFCLLLHYSVVQARDSYPVNAAIDVQHYSFALKIGNNSDEIEGTANVSIRFLADNINDFSLDLVGKKADNTGMEVLAVSQNHVPISFTHTNDRINISVSEKATKDEVHTFEIKYKGIPDDGLIIAENKFGDRTFFGDNWPNRAHYWLPTIDHPSDKATCEFIVTAPEYYQVIANGRKVEETALPQGLAEERMKLTHWVTSVPIPTKVMVIGAARFAIQYVDSNLSFPIESWVYPEDREAGFYDYEIAPEILGYMIDKVGKYAYEKLANVQSKTKYGGMENASNIFYSELTVNGTRNSEALMAHEIAHQWFGNSVSEADWHHVWLSEGFASYMTELYFESTYGRDSMNYRMADAKQKVLRFYADFPQSPIVDTTVQNLNKLLNANAYQKGAWVLHMLRYQVGDEHFWKGIQNYYQKYQNSNALTKDFQLEMEQASGQDLAWFFKQWIYQPGIPELNISWDYKVMGKKLEVTVNQLQNESAFQATLEIGVYYKGKQEPDIKTIQLKGKENTFTLKLDKSPKSVVIDPNQWFLMKNNLGT